MAKMFSVAVVLAILTGCPASAVQGGKAPPGGYFRHVCSDGSICPQGTLCPADPFISSDICEGGEDSNFGPPDEGNFGAARTKKVFHNRIRLDAGAK